MVLSPPEVTKVEMVRTLLQEENLYGDLVAREQRRARSSAEVAAAKVDEAIGYYIDSLGDARFRELMHMERDARAGKLHKVLGMLIDGIDFSGVEGRTAEVDKVIRATRNMIEEIHAHAVQSQLAYLRKKVLASPFIKEHLKGQEDEASLDRVINTAVRNVVIKYGPDAVNEWEGPELSVAISGELDAMERARKTAVEKWAAAENARIGPTQTTRALGGSDKDSNGGGTAS